MKRLGGLLLIIALAGPAAMVSRTAHGQLTTPVETESQITRLLAQARAEMAQFRYGEAQTLLRGEVLRDQPAALALLGWLHLDGRILPRDPALAFTSFKRAAEAGEPSAMTGLALTYRGGFGTSVDATLAKQWMQRAQEAQHPDAFAHFGDFYFEGFGFPKDVALALPLYERAASLGSAYGRLRLSEQIRATDAPRALALLQQAADQGDRMAQFRLAQTIIGEQLGLKRDLPLAGQWIQRAAQSGLGPAMMLYARLLETGEAYGPPNPGQALRWYQGATLAGVVNGWLAQSLLIASGKAGTQDIEQAARLAQRGAEAGDPAAQWQMAQWYDQGRGVIRSTSLAYAWASVAITSFGSLNAGSTPPAQAASAFRDRLGASFDSAQLAQAQGLARDWRSGALALQLQSTSDPLARAFRQQQPPLGQSLPNLTPPAPVGPSSGLSDGSLRRTGSGSGFFVSTEGHLITNQHVINQCTQMRLAGQSTPLTVIASDAAIDLAILRTPMPTGVKPVAVRRGPARQGEEIATYGYPLQGLLSSGGQINTGIVAALSGLRNDANQLQINAPVQAGSSGGPLLDRRGEVVGVVVSKLNALRVAQNTGDIPQNVNFAIKPEVLVRFMRAQGVEPVSYGAGSTLSTEGLAERARDFTVAVECWRN